jgi:hypothetical protein
LLTSNSCQPKMYRELHLPELLGKVGKEDNPTFLQNQVNMERAYPSFLFPGLFEWQISTSLQHVVYVSQTCPRPPRYVYSRSALVQVLISMADLASLQARPKVLFKARHWNAPRLLSRLLESLPQTALRVPRYVNSRFAMDQVTDGGRSPVTSTHLLSSVP